MNNLGPGIIDAVMLQAVKDAVESLIDDAQTKVSITISTPTANPTVDYAAGTVSETLDQDSVNALKGAIPLKEIMGSEGGLQVGDVFFWVFKSDLSSSPTSASTILEGSTRYRVLEVQEDPLQASYRFLARRS